MPRTVEKVESLISEDSAMDDALQTVLERSDGGAGEVEWKDVRDSLSSGQWGRLIETGILTDGDEGFTIADPAAIHEAVGWEGGTDEGAAPLSTPEDGADADEPGDASWTVWDKAAAIATLGLFAGYSLQQVRNLIGGSIDVLLGPLDALLPFYVVVMILALLTGFYSTVLQAHLMDMEIIGHYQEQMKDIQARQKEAKERGDDEELERIREEQMEAMGDQLGMFKAQFRPMVWIMLLTIPVFLWMYWMILEGRIASIENQIVIPIAGEATWRQGIAGPIQMWIVWYFVCSMAFTQVIRKALDIQTTPT